MKKFDIYKMFTGEIIAISILGSMTGVFFSSYIIYQLTTVTYYANKFLMKWYYNFKCDNYCIFV